ncbi:WD40 repeat-like protein [Meira miltonrushii]|uniref:Ribosome biogenesis protein YTM1 n=1 Tax=Meira miltonrushii TaxID=1280837 RepID=A0A316V0Y4_9BASI|nr:WD40 repeat-like protein [Meira miltonrushii]PWN31206.1 WD40 repeat-like protein [Meira miltonrushii]
MASSSTGPSGTMVESTPIRQVPIKLRTSQSTLSIPDVPYLVPTTWRRTQLSTLVNRLLQQGVNDEDTAAATKSIPFDFIIDGQLLRVSLDQYLQSKELTEESTLEIEYVRSTLPPTFTAAFEHDDWIGGIDASRKGYFLTSSYDGTLRVYGSSATEKPINTFRPTETASLTNVCWLNDSPSSSRLAVAGMDGALRICNLPTAEAGEEVLPASLESLSYTNAFDTTMPLSSVSVNSIGDTLATAGWDGCVAIWDAAQSGDVDGDDDRTSKRRKGVKGSSVAGKVPSKKPLSLLWHSTPVSGLERMPNTNARLANAVWNEKRSVISAGWDGAVRGWDISTASCTSTKTSDKVILALDAMSGQDLAVTGQMDRTAALWDLRSQTTNISLSFAHSAPVGSVRAHPTSSLLFVSGSYDGLVRLWDTRSPRAPLFSLVRPSGDMQDAEQKKKILALDWDPTGQTVVAGGEDCRLTVHHGHGIGREDSA